MLRVGLVVVALLCACKKKPGEPPPEPEVVKPVAPVAVEPPVETPSTPDPWLDAPRTPTPPTTPAPPTKSGFDVSRLKVPDAPVAVEALVRDARDTARTTAPELVVARITSSYVTKAGQLDATYGELAIDFQLSDSVDGVVDDPNRPTGAPVKDVAPAEKLPDKCPRVTFERDWTLADIECRKVKVKPGPSCTVAQIWSKAIADGAPDAAVAVVMFDARDGYWYFKITDKLRGVNFSRTYRDECKTAPTPSKPGKPNPFATDR